MRRIFLPAIFVFLTLSVSALSAEKKDNIHMFPEAKEGFTRYVIEVPKIENEFDHKVELMIGKQMMVDCNNRSFFGKINEVTLKGWGFTYLEVDKISPGVTTMMACPEPKSKKFISLYAPKETLRRYNSRSPIVVYVPEGYEVKYRIWSASETLETAEQR